ncbi:endonuclease Q family protein [Sutcliffiella horikoshii]|uniref:endonuclease Q family protein n=1 Tax=Sutcliffiella horikoshii TaxID=79883 RepID=UPI001F4918EC|nr:endonuclease Q family protein [Sutcliffiella horikoshii]MCG1022955.1 TIGR00375 family protein [Sutcliffiella horikoshii]
MKEYFVDLHIHLGGTASGKPVKITASNKLTLEAVLEEARFRKGLDMIGVIDCQVPEVLVGLRNSLARNEVSELTDGGIRIGDVTLILGAEIEIFDENCQGMIHALCYMKTVEKMVEFSNWLSNRMKNVTLSTQRVYENATEIQHEVRRLGGLFIPAHVFTPFKSLYGKGVKSSLSEVFEPGLIDAVELGLSSDTSMAERLEELEKYAFLSNSDAHSVGKIAREYQRVRMKEPTFEELRLALKEVEGRKVVANYGLSPQLGKYFTTVCEKCFSHPLQGKDACHVCGHAKFIRGVSDRISELAGSNEPRRSRPPYIHQVPLDFIPGVGPKTLAKLRGVFGTEMGILHEASFEELVKVVGEKVASLIVAARSGKVTLKAGGGGRFGRISEE